MKKPFELNDRVYDLALGYGTVTSTTKPEQWQKSTAPFRHKYEVTFESGAKNIYDVNGGEMLYTTQTLFYENPDIEKPESEFTPFVFELVKTKKNGFDYFEIWGKTQYGKHIVKQKTGLESFDMDDLRMKVELIRNLFSN